MDEFTEEESHDPSRDVSYLCDELFSNDEFDGIVFVHKKDGIFDFTKAEYRQKRPISATDLLTYYTILKETLESDNTAEKRKARTDIKNNILDERWNKTLDSLCEGIIKEIERNGSENEYLPSIKEDINSYENIILLKRVDDSRIIDKYLEIIKEYESIIGTHSREGQSIIERKIGIVDHIIKENFVKMYVLFDEVDELLSAEEKHYSSRREKS